MAYTQRGKKARREKALTPEPGQTTLTGQVIVAPQLAFKIPANPHTVFFGLGPGERSAKIGHYYPGATNQFWKFFYESGLWPEPITAEEDDKILAAGFGLADVSHRPTKGAVHTTKAAYFQARQIVKDILAKHHPKTIAFVGKESYSVFTRRATKDLEHGRQPDFEGVAVFLLPTPSNRNQSMPRKDKLAFYREMAEFVKANRN
jgi:mismatch-specific thymine-DNA glycosylase